MLIALGACLIGVIILFIVMTVGIQPSTDAPTPDNSNSGDVNSDNVIDESNIQTLTVTIGEKKFTLQLANTQAAKEFAEATPFELEMDDQNGVGKHYSGESLPTAAYDVGTIHAGDLLLYEDSDITLFYKDFETSYRYTKIGKITDPNGLAEALGAGSVNVIFTKQ